MSARDDVLNRVRAALGRPGTGTTPAGAVGSAPDAVEVPRAYRTVGDDAPGSPAVVDQLVDRLVDYKAHVHPTTPEGLPATIADLVAGLAPTAPAATAPGTTAPGTTGTERTVVRVVAPDGLDDTWLTALPHGVEVVRDGRGHPLAATELDATGAVVTAARIAISETGTIVLDGEPDQGRRAVSLVPDVHLCVVRVDQVVQTVPEAVRLLGEHPGRPLTWISGPSATSDIELDRVEGVHGPRTLHVLLVGAG
ncbi:LutC/YkgG family protein [Isoptericola jiangsuensis]|uniref:LutC/YkgG family protein n=1 Tax=Isoptericola jiangsuensis TaxID=548579 RepID=UPI003AAA214D